MADLRDYIQWRGDLTFEQSVFNEVDNVIFSFLCYVDFAGIVPENKEKSITVREASDAFWSQHTDKEILDKPNLTRMSAFVLRDMADSERFGNLYLSGYQNEVDEESQKQFAAIQIRLKEGIYYLAFRGTDETIVGWQEDFNMLYVPEVPAERRAVEYLRDALRGSQNVNGEKTCFYIGGHSKGGHLAIYAAVRCFDEFREQILHVFNNDGPGVNEIIASEEAYQNLLPRLTAYVPEQSFFGLMLIHKENTCIVKSSRSGLMQHDSLSWKVLGTSFVRAENVTPRSREVNDELKSWLAELSMEEREEIISSIFEIFSLVEIKSIGDFVQMTPKKVHDMLHGLKDVDSERKELINRAFRLLIHALLMRNRQPGLSGK